MSEVSILIKAVDEATAVLKSVKGQIGGLDEAGKKASSETGGLNNLNAKMAALGANLTSVGQNLSTFATVPLVAAGAGFIKLASDAQETSSKFDAVFKDMATDVRAWATEQAGNLNRSSIAWEGYLGNIQDTLVPLGFARDDAADLSKQIVLLAEDISSFNNLPTGDVLRSIQSGIVGNTENFRQFGVVVTQATLDQELMNMGINGGVKAATEQEKALARMNILMAQTTDAQGDAARTADSFANLVKGLQAAMQSLGVELGTRLLPLASDFIIRLTDIVTWFNSLPDPVGNVILVLGGLLAALGPVLLVVGQIITAITALTPLLPAIGAAFTALTGPIGLVVAAVGLVVAAFATDFMGVRTKTMEVLSATAQFFTDFIPKVKQLGSDLIAGLVSGITGMVGALKTKVTDTANDVLGWFKGVFQIQSPSKAMLEQGKFLLEGLINGLQDPALRSELQREIDAIGVQLFALNMAASGGLSPVGMTPSRPSIGGSNAAPNGVSDTTPTTTIGLFVDKIVELFAQPLVTVSDAVVVSLTPLAETAASVNVSMLPLVDTIDAVSVAASPFAETISAVDVTMSNYGATMATNLDISDQVTVSTQATLETIQATQQTFSSFSDFVATQFGVLGTGLLNLGNQIPFFGAAFNAGLQEITNQAGETIGFMFDPLTALTSIFFDLVGQSKAFSELIRVVNVLMQPFIQIFDVLTPVITGFALVLAAVYNALVVLANVVTFGAAHLLGLRQINMKELLGIDNIQGGKNTTPDAPTLPEVTAPVTTSSPSISQPEFDIGRLPSAVQFAVFTPLVETLDKLSIVVERLVDEGIKVQLQSNSSSATQRFRAA